MSEPLLRALNRMRGLILDPDVLVKAVASGRHRGGRPRWRRAELRYVDLKGGRQLQVVTYDETQAFTANHPPGVPARDAVDALLDEPFGNWHVDTTTENHQLRVTKRLEAVVHTAPRTDQPTADRSHDRSKPRLLPEDHPALRVLGISDETGRVKQSRQAKYRQVEEFLRLLDQSVTAAIQSGKLRAPTLEAPLRVVDLGCGNAYLTFATHRFLTDRLGAASQEVRTVGVDVRPDMVERNGALAQRLQLTGLSFEAGTIETARPFPEDEPPDLVLALHACDTATDDALAAAVRAGAPVVLAAPCCHHDVQRQLRERGVPAPYALLTRHGILRERLGDLLTDALRAAVLRLVGYRVDVVEFVDAAETPRNVLLRAVRTDASPEPGQLAEYTELVRTWRLEPALAARLAPELSAALAAVAA